MSMVITGLGTVSPAGTTTAEYWEAIREGRSLIGPIPDFDTDGFPVRLGGKVPGFRAREHLEGKYAVQTDAFTQFALVAADEAMTDARLTIDRDPFSVGALICSYAGGVEFGQREIAALWSKGPDHVGPYQSIAWFYAASTGQVSIRGGLKGMCGVLVTDEPGMLDALGQSEQALRRGTSAMLAGGSEAPLGSPFSLACQVGTELLSGSDDPASAYVPFTEQARGYVPAEGAAIVVVEDEETAAARGARPRAVVAGQASTFSDVGGFDPGGEGLRRAAREALRRAEISPDRVDVVFADALGVPKADADEVALLRGLFPDGVAVTAPKTGFGRAYAGSSALDVSAAVLTLEHQIIPPTPNVHTTVSGLDLVAGVARRTRVETALVLSRGLGGTNSAAVLTLPAPHHDTDHRPQIPRERAEEDHHG
ncbi:ketosynthase chain-length factor [Nocardiopsis alba]|uniref:Ketosynthase chain-length factor n=1 Tax=Nocardiopsis alba TaxID=53437 RepID=A0A7K2INY8_9ACTN|nr:MULTISPECIES: beta-ketoacyl synthase N-terminal-like domain-containing protein [Nocardiopsis]MEC3894058.1 beta-ketoacyl synthase N-terminal-like domain-containing protein [Nocardiopsis sp. LDBS1602]MYR31673.1 ketosynthase chain-length factor [Nocardiopsis alba]